ncbi:MAG: nucleotidyltransferase domain-containing protein [archaeon]
MADKSLQESYLDLAKSLSEELRKEFPEIVGLGVFGSLSVGTADEYSDIDLDIWLHEDAYIRWICSCPLLRYFEKYSIKRETPSNLSFCISDKYKLDLNLLSIEGVRKEEWKTERKATRYMSIILFDKEDIIKNLLKEKLNTERNNFENKEKYSVTTQNPEEYYLFFISAYLNYFTPLSLARKRFEQAHLNLNWGISLILELQWIKYYNFFPYTKSRWTIVDKFNDNQKDMIREAQLIKDHTENDVQRRRKILRELYSSLGYKEITFDHDKLDLS